MLPLIIPAVKEYTSNAQLYKHGTLKVMSWIFFAGHYGLTATRFPDCPARNV
jgi:hypothetical protein